MQKIKIGHRTNFRAKYKCFPQILFPVRAILRSINFRCTDFYTDSADACILVKACADCARVHLKTLSILLNGYPRGVINYNVNDLLHKHKDKPSQPTLTVRKKGVTLVLPYLGLHSDAITRRLKSCESFMVSSTSGLFFRILAELSLSFLIKIVSTGRRNRRLSTKPVAGIVMLFTSAKLKED